MQEIRLHGRGGQGTVTAAELIAVAAFYDGKFSQAFPSFGVERRGAPVSAFCRISGEKIRLRAQIYQPDFIIIQDAGLITTDPSVLQGAEKCRGILINSEKKDWPEIKNKNVITVPATKIALEKIGKPFINTALIGAFTAMSKLATLGSLRRAVEERFPPEVAASNIAAMQAAYDCVEVKIKEYKFSSI
ncbi:2-oxoacid:acceptor oxidoreductase family protein [Patescibacteria group bacterium]|nr:2-oxoacid:acceptor oxidoreductase family protein [Patescibacteria group bacterium]